MPIKISSFPFFFKPISSPVALRAYSTVTSSEKLSHLNEEGRAIMVDVTDKHITIRTAVARGVVRINYQTSELIKQVLAKKGDVLSVAQLAGIMGAKKTSELIPLCHNLPLTKVGVDLALNYEQKQIELQATVRCEGRTGVEMEALTAVSVAALTVYDMCKAVSSDIVISDISLVSQTGGKTDPKRTIVLREMDKDPLDSTEIRVGII